MANAETPRHSAPKASSLGSLPSDATRVDLATNEGASGVVADPRALGSQLVRRTKPGRHRPFLQKHPWVHAHALMPAESDFRGQDTLASESTLGELAQVRPVQLQDHDGNFLAYGVENVQSKLRLRLYSFEPDRPVTLDLVRHRLRQAISRRRITGPCHPEGGERLVYSEADGLSGLIIDRYAECLGIQFTAAALLPWGEDIIDAAVQLASEHGTPVKHVFCRVDESTAKMEAISPQHREMIGAWQRGAGNAVASDADASNRIWYRHNGYEMAVDLDQGQKTGGYLDQQQNQAAASEYCRGRNVLDVCCYTGGFSLAAAGAGARSVTGIDGSDVALQAARANAERNGFQNVEFVRGDCFEDLKQRGKAGERFEVVIVDPPRFAGNRHQIKSALRAYTRLNALAIDLIPTGGILVTCSCSGRVGMDEFRDAVRLAADRRRRGLTLLETRGAPPDHPVSLDCPETQYLKCLILQVSG
ncbi:MAG: class I SAM-dependent rRNA methyltransferase [Planctomycetota bacterium]